MKKLCILLAIVVFALAAFAEIAATALSDAPVDLGGPARALAIQCVSTNLSGQVTVQKITSLDFLWRESVVSVETNYVDVATNLSKVATNKHVRVWRTRYLGAGVVESNLYASAVNATPWYPNWPDLVVTTNSVVELTPYTNWTYRAVAGVVYTTNSVLRVKSRAFTNTLLSATLSGGQYTNAMNAALMPGDKLRATGTALAGGMAYILFER